MGEYGVWNGIQEFRSEMIWTVAAVLADLGLHPSYGRSGVQLEPTRAAWEFPLETPIPFFASFELPQQHTDNNYNYTIWSPPPVPDETPVNIAWSRTARGCDGASNQTVILHYHSRSLARSGGLGTLSMMEMQPYRRVGVVLWDFWRVFSIGLMPNTRRETTPTPDGGFISPDPNGETRQEWQSRWLAVVNKKLPLGYRETYRVYHEGSVQGGGIGESKAV